MSSTSIKIEHESDDEFVVEPHQPIYTHRPSSETNRMPVSLYPSTYKGKIEVTSKGRRKIFDGVRWQILCRRADCRKQTNKKSLCITHYKEEYEKQLISAHSMLSYYSDSSRMTTNENQNDAISTTNSNDSNEHHSLNSSEGQVKWMRNGRRYIFKNQRWEALCKYDNLCQSIAQSEFYCKKHIQTTKRRTSSESNETIVAKKLCSGSSIEPILSSSSSVTDQFDINSEESEIVKFPSSPSRPSPQNNKNQSNVYPIRSTRRDQSIQTDITIPFCCFVHYGQHALFSSCHREKSTSSIQHLQYHSHRSSR